MSSKVRICSFFPLVAVKLNISGVDLHLDVADHHFCLDQTNFMIFFSRLIFDYC